MGQSLSWEGPLTLIPIPGAVHTSYLHSQGVPEVPSLPSMPEGPCSSRKIEGDSQWGDAWGQGPPPSPSAGAVCKWEVGLVSLGSPSSQLGEQNGSGKGFQEMDDSPSLVWVMSVSRPLPCITTLFTGEKPEAQKGHFPR